MILLTLCLIQLQTYHLPVHLNEPEASWGDWNGDGKNEIWVQDNRHNQLIIDADGVIHSLEFDGSPQRVFPFFWQEKWYAGTLIQSSISVYRKDNWCPVLKFPGRRFRNRGRAQLRGSTLVLPVLEGYELVQKECPTGILELHPNIHLNRKHMNIQFPGVQLKDINHDGFPDFQSPPTLNESRGTLRINSFIAQKGFWSPLISDMIFPRKVKIQNWATGYLDEDEFPELVVLTAQPQGGSLFEEMKMVVYHGEGHGKWGKLPLQTITTRQNIWQSGPIEISRKGVRLYYYKGLVRALFRMDLYPLLDSEIVRPRPESKGWKMKDADRGLILNQLDLNRDGIPDLLLSDERGLILYPGHKDSTFEEHSGYVVGPREENYSVGISIGNEGIDMFYPDQNQQVEGDGSLTMLLLNDTIQFWSLNRDETGEWILRHQKMEWEP